MPKVKEPTKVSGGVLQSIYLQHFLYENSVAYKTMMLKIITLFLVIKCLLG